ncbi:MAG: fibronectin type III domain-containing protein, partial [Bacteroidales bacterium]|nr:fibronectin type III domain-containing protein [Bacteroidales bacterium]
MKRLLLFAMAIIFAMQLSAQTTIVVGDTNTASEANKHPMYMYYESSFQESLYPQSELTPGLITSISYYADAAYSNGTLKIYMKEVSNSTLSDLVIANDFTEVFVGSASVQNGRNTYQLTTPFAYTGAGNLLVAVIRNGDGYTNSPPYFKKADGTGASFCYYYDDTEFNININPSSDCFTDFGSFVPVTKFEISSLEGFCFPPANVVASDVTTDGATISWGVSDESATTFGLAYKALDEEEWTVESENITEFTYTLSGLESYTQYQVKVYTVCEESNSNEIIIDLYTLPSEDNFITIPYQESFDDLEALSFWSFSNPNTNKWYVGALGHNSTANDETVGNGLYISNDNGLTNTYTTNVVSVAHASVLVNIEEDNLYGISFDYRSVAEEWSDYVLVRLVPFGAELGTSTTQANQHVIGNSPGTTNNQWQRADVFVPSDITPGAYYLTFTWRNDSYSGEQPPASIDNVSVYTMSCTPTSLEASLSFTETEEGPTVVVNLVDEVNTEATYAIKYRSAGSATWTEITDLSYDEFPYSLTEGIEFQTNYDVHVRILCEGLPEFVYPEQMSISTPCGALQTPWMEAFNVNPLPYDGSPTCWNRYTGRFPSTGQVTTSDLTPSSSNWNFETLTVGGVEGKMMYANLYSTDQYYWLVTPSVNLGEGDVTKQIGFDVALRQWSSDSAPGASPDDKFIFMVSLDNGETWNAANGITFADNDEDTEHNFSGLTNQMQRVVYTLVDENEEPLTGAVRFAFYGESTVGGGGDNRLCIDNIAVEDVVDCPLPYNVAVSNASITAESATATFSYYGSSTAWEYVVVEGNDPNTGTPVEVTTTEAIVLTDLSPATNYTFAVRAVCTDGTSEWVSVPFSTLAEAAIVPFESGFDGDFWTVTNGAVSENVWTIGVATGNEAPAAYISNDGGESYAATIQTEQTISHLWKDFDFGETESDFELSFDWKATGYREGYDVYGGLVVYLTSTDPLPENGLLDSDDILTILTDSDDWQSERIFLGNVTGNKRLVFTALGYTDESELTAPAALDNVALTVSTCSPVENVVLSNPTTTTLDVAWDLTEADSYIISYKATGSDEVITEPATESPFTITDLQPATIYTVTVSGVCGSDEGIASAPVSAYTLQEAVELPYTCDFEEEGSNGWLLKNGDLVNQWHVGTPSNATSGSLYISDNNGASAHYNTDNSAVVVAEKLFALGATDSLRISFDITIQGQYEDQGYWEDIYDYLKVFFVDPTVSLEPTSDNYSGFADYSNGEGVIFGNPNGDYFIAMENGTVNKSVTIENYPNEYRKLVFVWVNNAYSGQQPPAIIDNVMIEPVGEEITCVKPVVNSVVASGITESSATISWTDNDDSHSAWNVYYKADEDEDYTVVAATETTIDLSNLENATRYSVYVTTNCGSGDESAPTDIIMFNTECLAIDVFPYLEGFNNSQFLCWNPAPTDPEYDWTPATEYVGSNYDSSIPPAEGAGFALFYTESYAAPSSRLTSPIFDLTVVSSPYLKYSHISDAWGNDIDELKVQYRTSPEEAWVDLANYTTDISTWTVDSIALPNPSATYQIAFVATSHYGYGVGLDDLMIFDADAAPYFPPTVTTLDATEISEYGATLNGTVVAGSDEIIEQGFKYKAASETTWTSIVLEGEELSHSLTDLNHSTEYLFKAFATTAIGTVDGAIKTFTTLCGAIDNFPYTQDFESSIACWERVTLQGEPTNEHAWTIKDAESIQATLGSATGNAIYHTWDMGVSGRLITPMFDLTSLTNPYVKFDYARLSDGVVEGLTVHYKASAEDSWTLLATMNGTPDQWVLDSIALPNPSETYQIAFVSEGVDGYGVLVDNFIVYDAEEGEEPEPEPCDAPTALVASNITQTTADITWTGTATSYEFKLNGGTAEALTATTKSLTGLTANTQYTVEVRAVCGDQTSDWTSIQFTTLQETGGEVIAPTVTTLAATAITHESATLNGTITAGSETITAQGFMYKATAAADWTTVNATGTTISATLSTLTAETEYTFKAFATTATGTVEGTAMTFTTTAAPVVVTPPTVATLAATAITHESATLNGTITAGSETITAQGFMYKATAAADWTTVNATGTTISATLSALTAETEYTFKAFATTATGTVEGEAMT